MPLAARPRLVRDDFLEWVEEIEEQKNVRASRKKDYRKHYRNYVAESSFGALPLNSVTREALVSFKNWLENKAGKKNKGVSQKTTFNVIMGTTRAWLRDRQLGMQLTDSLPWQDLAPTREQDPFEPEEVTALLGWFREKRPFREFVSLELRFQGVTPSEARGLLVGDFSRRAGTLTIRRSQDSGEVGATKARSRRRPVFLSEQAAANVALLCGLRDPSEPILSGLPEKTLENNWKRAIKALGLRYRSLYQAKHSFAVNSLLAGASPAVVARNLGISLATLEKHYAAFLRRQETPIVGFPGQKGHGGTQENPNDEQKAQGIQGQEGVE